MKEHELCDKKEEHELCNTKKKVIAHLHRNGMPELRDRKTIKTTELVVSFTCFVLYFILQ